MSWLWIILGVVLILLGILELLLAVFNYDVHGLLIPFLQRLLWRVLKYCGSFMPTGLKRKGFNQPIGLLILLGITMWGLIEVVGFGLVYYGLMAGNHFIFANNTVPGLSSAMYFSGGQLTTVGNPVIQAASPWARTISIVEATIGLFIFTLAISFVADIIQTIKELDVLSSFFYYKSQKESNPLDIVTSHIYQGKFKAESELLQYQYDHLLKYFNGLCWHHIVYYFRSNRNRFSLPYTLHMVGGTLGILCWGTSSDTELAHDPQLAPTLNLFNEVLEYLAHAYLPTLIKTQPPQLSYEEFLDVVRGKRKTEDIWLAQFRGQEQKMSQMMQTRQPVDMEETYKRYIDWLQFTFRTQQVTEAVAEDLGYKISWKQGTLQWEK